MTAGNDQSVAVGTVVDGQWVHGLLDCCAFGGNSFCASLLCAPCMIGVVQAQLEGGESEMDSALCFDMSAATVVGLLHSPYLSACACCFSFASYAFWQRREVRKASRLPGDCLGDLMTSFLCTPCVATQNYNQITQSGYAYSMIAQSEVDGEEAQLAK